MKNSMVTTRRSQTARMVGWHRLCMLPVALLLAGVALTANAVGPGKGNAADVDPALVEAIVRRLESDGTLDKAVERALGRVIARQEEEQKAAQTRKQAELRNRATAARKVSVSGDHIRGNPSAEVSLIEYSDFECPFCKRFHATPPALLQRFGKQVNWVYRHFPLDFHNPVARQEAVAAECAGSVGGNEAFWKYADTLYQTTRSNGQGLPDETSLEKLAEKIKIDGSGFSRCMEDGKAAKRVEMDIAEGAAMGIQGTPTTLIRNNRTGATDIVVGAQALEAFVPVIERLLGGR